MEDRFTYGLNPEKLGAVSSYLCDPNTAPAEFLLVKSQYLAETGRAVSRGALFFQIRQAFPPGEVTPEEANKIGYELASRLLNGDFAFLVATHDDHAHIHNHIVFSAVSLDCTRKFKDVLRSGKVVAELSDSLCREHRLSIVENPQDKTVSYDKWQGSSARTTSRDTIRMMIDSALRMQPDGFDVLMQLLEEAGCRVKRGAQISVKPPSGKRFIRLDSLGAAYTEAALRNVLDGRQVHIPRIPRSQYTGRQIALLIDIEKKMREGKGRGYQVWAERHNLDAVSQSIIYLKENGINSYEELMSRIADGTKRRNQLKDSMKTCQTRMKAVSEQRKAVLTYRRTQAIYVQYRESGWSPQFYQAHAKEIEAHKAAQAVYAKADGKLPTLAELSAEYERLLCQKRADSAAFAEVKAEVSSLWHIKTNMDTIASDEPIEEKKRRVPTETHAKASPYFPSAPTAADFLIFSGAPCLTTAEPALH